MKKILTLLVGSALGLPLMAQTPAFTDHNLQGSHGLSDLRIESGKRVAQRDAASLRKKSADGFGNKTLDEALGTPQRMARFATAYVNDNGYMYTIDRENIEGVISIDGDKVYMKNPISSLVTDTWIEGTVTDEGLRFDFPQLIMVGEYREADGYTYEGWYYVNRVVPQLDEDGVRYLAADADKNYVIYTPNREGGYDFECDYKSVTNPTTGSPLQIPSYYMGVTVVWSDELDLEGVPEWGWCNGDGNLKDSMVSFDEEEVVPPAGLETSTYVMSLTGGANFVEIGYDGDDVYIQGVSSNIPEAWIKGWKVDDKTLAFKSEQLLGTVSTDGSYAWLSGGDVIVVEDTTGELYYQAIPEDQFELILDEETGVWNTLVHVIVTGGYGRDTVYELSDKPTFKPEPVLTDFTPATPTLLEYSFYDELYGMGVVHFTAPAMTVDNEYLRRENMYIRMLIDNTPYKYYAADGTIYEWIPYSLRDNNIMSQEGEFYMFYYEAGEHNLAIQTRYVDAEGKEWLSAPHDNGYESGVAEVEDETAEAIYYTLDGLKVDRPTAPGLYIRRQGDRTDKILVR